MVDASKLNSAIDYCNNTTKQSGSSFYYSFLFLSKEQRQAMTAVYAFCRHVDDIVDECTDKNIAQQKIFFWQDELNKIYTSVPSHPIAIALQTVTTIYDIPKVWFEQILAGMSMDLAYQGYENFSDLNVYCHNVASTVGMICTKIFGYENEQTLEFAKKLGLAMQYINIIRDVSEDKKLNRVYIPEELLTKFDINSYQILHNEVSQDKLAEVLSVMAKMAQDYEKQAMKLLSKKDRANQLSSIIMKNIYFSILNKIKKNNFNVLNKKIRITPITKIFIAIKTMLLF